MRQAIGPPPSPSELRAPRIRLRDANPALRHELALLVDNTAEAVIGCSPAGVITSWNRAAERIYGYSPAEAVGRAITLLSPPGKGDEVSRIIERTAQGGAITTHETLHKNKAGALIQVELSFWPIRDRRGRVLKVLALVRDLGPLRRARHIARNAVDQYHQLLDSVPCGIFYMDPAGKLLYANRALARILAYPSVRDLFELDWKASLFHGTRAFADFLAQDARFGQTAARQAVCRRADKTPVRVRLTTRLVTGDRKELAGYEVFVEEAIP